MDLGLRYNQMVEYSLHKNSHKNRKKHHQNNDERDDPHVGEIFEDILGEGGCSFVSNFPKNPLLDSKSSFRLLVNDQKRFQYFL